jgi:branched-chain amino acid transport system substrate-binding protein
MKKWVHVLSAGLLSTVLVAGCGGGGSQPAGPAAPSGGSHTPAAAPAAKGTIKIGGLFDETGGTGDVGKPYAEGEKAFVDYLNA